MPRSVRGDELRAQIATIDTDLQALAETGDPKDQARFDGLLAERESLVELAARHDAISATADMPERQVHQAGSPDELRRTRELSGLRGEARRRIERSRSATDDAKQTLTTLVERDGEDRELMARWAYATSSDAYASAFARMLRDPVTGHLEFDARELEAWRDVKSVQRALAVGTNTQGGYLVPSHLDPSIILSSAGSTNVLRTIARVETLADGNVWNGVSSAGVSASFDAEFAEVSDDSPSLSNPQVPVYTARAFVAASLEAYQDAADIDEQVMRLFADARDVLEGAKFATGSGVGEPTGIFTALDANTNVELQVQTNSVIDLSQLDRAYLAVPARFRPRATWAMSPLLGTKIKELGTAISAAFSGDLTTPPTERIHGHPVVYSDDLPGVMTTTAVDNLLAFGDFSQFLIADRVGMSVEFVPHLFSTTSARPIGARGWFAYWRTGSDTLVDDAFVLLQNKTSA